MTDFVTAPRFHAVNLPPSHYLPPRRRRRFMGIGCLWAAFVLILLTFLTCGISLALYVIMPPPSLNVLIMGMDARAGEGLLTRSDSNLVLGVQPQRLQTSLMSIPRDIFITMPNYGLQRINTINALAEQNQRHSGAQTLAQSVELSFGIPIDRYLRLDFGGFVALVDALGGIHVDVPQTLVDYNYPTADYGTQTIRFEVGYQHMNGTQALAYARTRVDDDYRRAQRQQSVLRAILTKAINPVYWLPAWATLQSSIDTNLSPLDVATILPPILLRGGQMNQLVISRDYVLPRDGYVVPDYQKLRPWLDHNLSR